MGGKRCNGLIKACVVVMVMVVLGSMKVDGAPTAGQCKAERNELVSACQQLIHKKPPTPYCCQRLRITHLECVCAVITPKLALLIDVNYGLGVLRGCGIKLPRHYKCGSITLP